MIYQNPSETLLRAADVIALFDPNKPGWHEVLVSAVLLTLSPKDFLVVDIPVDSTDWVAVQRWRDGVSHARK